VLLRRARALSTSSSVTEQEREVWAHRDATIAPHEGNSRRQIEALFAAHLATVKDKGC
jgi:hypothetical protein